MLRLEEEVPHLLEQSVKRRSCGFEGKTEKTEKTENTCMSLGCRAQEMFRFLFGMRGNVLVAGERGNFGVLSEKTRNFELANVGKLPRPKTHSQSSKRLDAM